MELGEDLQGRGCLGWGAPAGMHGLQVGHGGYGWDGRCIGVREEKREGSDARK